MSIKSKIESLLFVSARPLSVKQLADILDERKSKIKKECEELVKSFKNSDTGIQIIKNGLKYQMVSSKNNSVFVQKFLKNEISCDLSKPSLETLTIIAYRSPISKLDIDRIRGINCSLILRNLLLRGFIETKIKNNQTYYNLSFDFIRFLGISDVKELPNYEKLSKDDTIDRILND